MTSSGRGRPDRTSVPYLRRRMRVEMTKRDLFNWLRYLVVLLLLLDITMINHRRLRMSRSVRRVQFGFYELRRDTSPGIVSRRKCVVTVLRVSVTRGTRPRVSVTRRTRSLL